MNIANVPMPSEILYSVYFKPFDTATKLRYMVGTDGKTTPRVVHWAGKLPDYAKYLRTRGVVCTVKIRTGGMLKVVDNKGITYMFLGYPDDHAGDCYEMLKWNTERVWTNGV